MLLLFAVALIVYAKFDPEESRLFPKCIFHSLTGLLCPGCGSQRAIHQLLNGNIIEALHYNAFAVLAIPYIIVGFMISILKENRTTLWIRRHLYGKTAAIIILIAIIAFWVIRNIL